jgi:hypothetical protein
MNRTDGALVRIITPIVAPEGEAVAEARLKGFLDQMAPLLPAYLPN